MSSSTLDPDSSVKAFLSFVQLVEPQLVALVGAGEGQDGLYSGYIWVKVLRASRVFSAKHPATC